MKGITYCPLDFGRHLESYINNIKNFRVMIDTRGVSCFLTTNKMHMSCHPNILFIGDENNSVTIYNVQSIRIEGDCCNDSIDDIIVECSNNKTYSIFAEKIL